MSRFQLIVDGRLIGNDGPEFAYSAYQELSHLPRSSDPRLGRPGENVDVVLDVLRAEDGLDDHGLLQLTEAQDDWRVEGYFHGDDAVVLAQRIEGPSLVGPVLIAVVPCAEYAAIVEAARRYWAGDDPRLQPSTWRVDTRNGVDQRDRGAT
jgi:hypothetical protein